MLKGHGDNAYQYNSKIIADFSSNVYFKGTAKGLTKHLNRHLFNIGNYPEITDESFYLLAHLFQLYFVNTIFLDSVQHHSLFYLF